MRGERKGILGKENSINEEQGTDEEAVVGGEQGGTQKMKLLESKMKPEVRRDQITQGL